MIGQGAGEPATAQMDSPMFGSPHFVDRADAGRKLAEVICRRPPDAPVVLALPRGGVPVAFEIASALHAPLDLLLVRKIGAPGYPEFALGAVVDGDDPQMVLNEQAMAYTGASQHYVEEEAAKLLKEIERRRQLYFGKREPIPLKGRNVIVVDDGVATGATVKAGLKALRAVGVSSILLAVPVAPKDVIGSLAAEVDQVVCLQAPEDFRAVSLHYRTFGQTPDDEVVTLLDRAKALAGERP
jgi:putative phosphoribosyl transferase